RAGRELKFENDANCFALSEAVDGAGAGHGSVFGVIIGTGCGGGIVERGKILTGANAIGGEWGHNPLPWPDDSEYPAPLCWCGRHGCQEVWLSGSGLARDHEHVTGKAANGEEIVVAAQNGDASARATLERHTQRLAKGLACVVNILDPEVIVLGGGLSKLEHLYERLPELMRPNVFSDSYTTKVLPPKHGDASGVRGAAWLWNDQ
ncbi:MAG: ROK family protein, partial [Hyphomicrobiales bacterium]